MAGEIHKFQIESAWTGDSVVHQMVDEPRLLDRAVTALGRAALAARTERVCANGRKPARYCYFPSIIGSFGDLDMVASGPFRVDSAGRRGFRDPQPKN